MERYSKIIKMGTPNFWKTAFQAMMSYQVQLVFTGGPRAGETQVDPDSCVFLKRKCWASVGCTGGWDWYRRMYDRPLPSKQYLHSARRNGLSKACQNFEMRVSLHDPWCWKHQRNFCEPGLLWIIPKVIRSWYTIMCRNHWLSMWISGCISEIRCLFFLEVCNVRLLLTRILA